MRTFLLRISLLIGAASALVGCVSRGPVAIPIDRFNYNEAIANSMQEQLLLNIVRMRYGEAPFFLDIASVVQQYSRTGRVDTGALATFGGSPDGQLSVGVSGIMVETPTITYRPIVGAELVKQLVEPIPPNVVITLMAHGWEPRELMLITVERLNELRNPLSGGASLDDISTHPDFLSALDTLSYVHHHSGFRVRATPVEGGGGVTLEAKPPVDDDPDVIAARERLRHLLDLPPDSTTTEITASPRTAQNQIAIETRSVMAILTEIARDIDAPERDVLEGRALPGRDEHSLSLATIRCADTRPPDAYITVHYRNTWFYVPDNDLKTKRVFALLQVLLAVQTSRDDSLGPQITVGAGG